MYIYCNKYIYKCSIYIYRDIYIDSCINIQNDKTVPST